jgi:hypothetical protein
MGSWFGNGFQLARSKGCGILLGDLRKPNSRNDFIHVQVCFGFGSNISNYLAWPSILSSLRGNSAGASSPNKYHGIRHISGCQYYHRTRTMGHFDVLDFPLRKGGSIKKNQQALGESFCLKETIIPSLIVCGQIQLADKVLFIVE